MQEKEPFNPESQRNEIMEEVITMPDINLLTANGFGEGAIKPTEKTDSEVKLAVLNSQAVITDPTPVCIDGRPSADGAQPVRPKMAGGTLATGFAAAELAGWSLYRDAERSGDVEGRFAKLVDYMKEADIPFGGHKDNHHHLEDGQTTDGTTGCGAADKFVPIMGDIAEHGDDESFKGMAQTILGGNFKDQTWSNIVGQARTLAANDALKGWRGDMVAGTLEKNGVLESLNGDVTGGDEARHNHWEEAILVNVTEGVSNNRDASDTQHFQVDVPAIVDLMKNLATSEEEFGTMLHAAVAYQLGTAYRLTSDQRVIVGS